jgi:hypothetical protein
MTLHFGIIIIGIGLNPEAFMVAEFSVSFLGRQLCQIVKFFLTYQGLTSSPSSGCCFLFIYVFIQPSARSITFSNTTCYCSRTFMLLVFIYIYLLD